jgi:CRISPR-associated exonuclease Cas4
MQVTGTHFNYYFVCRRKLWLFANGINMEHTSDLVHEGKLLHETSYPQRPERYTELEIGGVKLDFYDARNRVIHEIKKSNKMEEAHQWQVKYYLYVLEQHGVTDAKGILEYPALRHREEVVLNDDDRQRIRLIEADIEQLTTASRCPDRIKSKICKNCSYYEFCYVEE